MKGGPAYLIMTILLLSSNAGSEEKTKDEDSKNPPPAESKETSSSPAEEQKQPLENKDPPPSPSEEKKQPQEKKEPPASPSEEKKQPQEKKETPPSPSEEKKSPTKDKKEKSDNDQGSVQQETKKDKSKNESGNSPPPAKEEENLKKENVNKDTASKQKEKEKRTSDKENSKSSQSKGAVVGLKSPVNTQVEDNWLLGVMKMVDKKGMVTKLVTQVTFKNLPEDLTGKSEEDIMGYVDILAAERENIQERLLFGMGLKMFVGFVSYEYYNHGLLLSPLKYLADNDVNLSVSIGQQWGDHQERLANFVCKLMKVRKIDVNSLPKSQLGIPLIKLKRAKDAVVSFPVWRTEEEAELPPEAKQITSDSKSMLLNFWVN